MKRASTANASIRFIQLSMFCILSLPASRLHADGGAMRLSQRVDGYQVTVFTAPTPLRAGPVDVSVFVQEADTGEPAAGVHVAVQAAPSDKPDQAVSHPATAAAATNKLFQSAIFELPESGRWQIVVTLAGERGQAQLQFEVEAAGPRPSWLETAPWVGWPALAVLLFAIHHMLVRRKTRGNASPPSLSRGGVSAIPTEIPF